MPIEPFRFLHASGLRLDEPLVGTGPLDGDLRILAEDATLTALDNVVEACLQHQIKRLIYTSSPSVTFDGHHQNNTDESAPYAKD